MLTNTVFFQKKATEEMPNEVRNGSTKQQSNKKNGNSSIKRTTKKAVNGSAEKQKPQKIGKLQPFAQGKLKSLYPSAGKCVVVVESVTKAKVIQGYLGDMYEVLPSYGHVRDLAARSGSVRPDDDFSIVWEVPSAAWTHLNSIKVALSGYDLYPFHQLPLNGGGYRNIECVIKIIYFYHPEL